MEVSYDTVLVYTFTRDEIKMLEQLQVWDMIVDRLLDNERIEIER